MYSMRLVMKNFIKCFRYNYKPRTCIWNAPKKKKKSDWYLPVHFITDKFDNSVKKNETVINNCAIVYIHNHMVIMYTTHKHHYKYCSEYSIIFSIICNDRIDLIFLSRVYVLLLLYFENYTVLNKNNVRFIYIIIQRNMRPTPQQRWRVHSWFLYLSTIYTCKRSIIFYV